MRRALIISPDLELCDELTADIETAGIETDCVRSFEEAIESIGQTSYHVIFAEPALDEGKALDIIPHLDRERPPILVVLCDNETTARALVDVGPSNVRAGERPMNKSKLRELLREVMQSGRQIGAPPTKPSVLDNGVMLGNCAPMRQVYELIARVAPTDATVLVIGESGTGKELVAHAVHERGARCDGPFEAINCGAIPETLIESELFGHVKGAFTGAERDHEGVFARAAGGTLFLDEITEMPIEMQVRLLRVIEERRFRPVGGKQEIPADVRLIAATNRDPAQAVAEGELREDLLYRISVFPLHLPPLRDREDDVILLANHFLSHHNRAAKTDKQLSDRGCRRLRGYHWPGNVRQLRNMVERAYIMEDDTVEMNCLSPLLPPTDGECDGCSKTPASVAAPLVIEHAANGAVIVDAPVPYGNGNSNGRRNTAPAVDREVEDDEVVVVVGTSIDEAERVLIERTLEELDGDKKAAAEMLGISLKTLYNRLKAYKEEDEAEAKAAD